MFIALYYIFLFFNDFARKKRLQIILFLNKMLTFAQNLKNTFQYTYIINYKTI